MQQKKLDDLHAITDVLLKQCIKNMKDIESVINVLETLQNPCVLQNESNNQLQQIDDSMTNSDIIIERRIDLHKELGTFVASEPHFPTITPLSKLNTQEQNDLYRQIFMQATNYVANIANVLTDDSTFDTQVATEADRLLNVWIDINKKR